MSIVFSKLLRKDKKIKERKRRHKKSHLKTIFETAFSYFKLGNYLLLVPERLCRVVLVLVERVCVVGLVDLVLTLLLLWRVAWLVFELLCGLVAARGVVAREVAVVLPLWEVVLFTVFVCVLVFLCVALLPLRLTGLEVPVETLLPFDVGLLEDRLVRVASAVFVREVVLFELLLAARTDSVVPVLLVLLFSAGLAFVLLVLSFVELVLSLLF